MFINILQKAVKKILKLVLLATEGTIKTWIYNKFLDTKFKLINPQENLSNKSMLIKLSNLLKWVEIKEAEKAIRPAVNYLLK